MEYEINSSYMADVLSLCEVCSPTYLLVRRRGLHVYQYLAAKRVTDRR